MGLKSALWTDEKGSQEQYDESVQFWNLFYDNVPENTSGKDQKIFKVLF